MPRLELRAAPSAPTLRSSGNPGPGRSGGGTAALCDRCGEEIAVANGAEARTGIGAWLSFYNDERQHQSLGYRTPRQIYEQGLWICGRSALPTGSASPTSRASAESGEMLAFAHIPTDTTASKELDIDEVKGRSVAAAAIGADIEIGRATP